MPDPMLTPITPPLAEEPRPGSGALLPTLGRAVTNVEEDRLVGFTFNPENCGESGTIGVDPCVAASNKAIPDNEPIVAAWPFGIWAGDKCSPTELGRDWRGRARRQLAATRSYQVARELWTGAEADDAGAPNRRLADVDSDVLTDDATSPTDALARLEQGLADCIKGARGVIHATRHAATFWAQLGLLRREGNQLLTFLDTIVIADAGYDGSGPDGQAATDGSQWAYATGMPIVRLGPESTFPENMAQATNRSTNMVEFRAEQKAAVSWDGCCHLAVELELGWLDLGGAGS